MSALTQEDVNKLEKAIVSGTLVVRFKDHSVTYKSQTEMERALKLAKRAVAGSSRTTRTVANYSSGF